MRIVFAGTPEFAAVSLEALLGAGHEVALVLTQPDRPAGRGQKPRASAVKRLAASRGLRLVQPQTLREESVQAALAAARPEAIVVVAYGLLVPRAVLELPPAGCLNVHASLLPRWRGAAPIQRALLAGDALTGVTVMRMDEGLDTGPILLQEAVPIGPEDTAGTLHDRLARLGAGLLVRALATPGLEPRPQDERAATYAPRIRKEEARIDWTRSAEEIERAVRAFDPAPGAQTHLDGLALKIWRAAVVPGVREPPGTVCEADEKGILVACGRDALRITELQRAGGRRLPAGAFLAGARIAPGTRLGRGDA
jgi:methionyl-tRNA formyltransferase